MAKGAVYSILSTRPLFQVFLLILFFSSSFFRVFIKAFFFFLSSALSHKTSCRALLLPCSLRPSDTSIPSTSLALYYIIFQAFLLLCSSLPAAWDKQLEIIYSNFDFSLFFLSFFSFLLFHSCVCVCVILFRQRIGTKTYFHPSSFAFLEYINYYQYLFFLVGTAVKNTTLYFSFSIIKKDDTFKEKKEKRTKKRSGVKQQTQKDAS